MKKTIKNFIKSNKKIFRLFWFVKKKQVVDTLRKNINGSNNKIQISLLSNFDNCVLEIIGHNNELIVGECSEFKNVKIFISGNHNKVIIGDRVSFVRGGEIWIEDNNCSIVVGDKTTFENVHLAATEDNSEIIIGEDCMFAYDIDVRTGDSHSILDASTNQRTNYAKSVIIGNHVWVASHCSILKGVKIGNNNIVGTRSLVIKNFPQEGCVIGGNPAGILRSGVTWERQRIKPNA
jgi:acetyltransferase-like isoleucine patch superfamily enzyme